MSLTKTTCPYCGVGCGVDVQTSNEQPLRAIAVNGTSNHPANLGRLCVKGSSLHETTESKHRILSPRMGSDTVSWDTALDTVATRFQQTIQQYGKDSVAFYLSGQLLTEDYYVANKLMKGYIGTANVDTNSRLCMASAVVGYKRAFGADAVPCSYEDLESSDLIILIGSNAAWTHPVLYQRMVAAKKARPDMKVVLIDPRKTASADIADLHLPLKPASDGFLFNGLLNYLIEHQFINQDYINQHTDGFETTRDAVNFCSLEKTAEITGLAIADLIKFFNWFANTEKTISFYSQGINQSSTGSDKCNAIINCHLATGKIGKEGAGPFSITGQPNAMGGREVGGLANQLAAHMDFLPDDTDRVQRFWDSPSIATEPGLKAVDLFDAIEEGKIKAVWIMATNPAVSLPNSEKVRSALEKCDFVVVSDYVENDTSHYADIVLPSTSWGEKDGTVTNSERRISRQRPMRSPVGEAKHDWWQMAQVAQRMGYAEHFTYNNPVDVFREHAALSGFEQGTRLRDFDISAFADINDAQYEQFTPVQWPVNAANPKGVARLFTDGKFYTDNRKAKFISGEPKLNAVQISRETPLLLNTGRIRDQWHTMTRTGTAGKLLSHIDAPYIEVHPDDVERYGLEDGKLATLSNQYGEFIGVVNATDSVLVGTIFSPIHWTDQFAKQGVISAVVAPEVDPYSGQPESKAIPVNITNFDANRWAVIALSDDLATHFANCLEHNADIAYWCKAPSGSTAANGASNERYFLAISDTFNWQDVLDKIKQGDSHAIQFGDEINRDERIALVDKEDVKLVVYSHSDVNKLPSTTWLAGLLEQPVNGAPYTLVLGEQTPPQKMICTCFQVTQDAIETAIEDGCRTPEELGQKLKCGTNCGSCIPELKNVIGEAKSNYIKIVAAV